MLQIQNLQIEGFVILVVLCIWVEWNLGTWWRLSCVQKKVNNIKSRAYSCICLRLYQLGSWGLSSTWQQAARPAEEFGCFPGRKLGTLVSFSAPGAHRTTLLARCWQTGYVFILVWFPLQRWCYQHTIVGPASLTITWEPWSLHQGLKSHEMDSPGCSWRSSELHHGLPWQPASRQSSERLLAGKYPATQIGSKVSVEQRWTSKENVMNPYRYSFTELYGILWVWDNWSWYE